MKVVTLTTRASAEGTCQKGTVLDMSNEQAKLEMESKDPAMRFVREYDAKTDAKKPRGLSRAKESDE